MNENLSELRKAETNYERAEVVDMETGEIAIDRNYGGSRLRSSNDVDETSPIEPMSDNGNVREINITALNSGFLVRVGCQSLAVERTDTLLARLGDYLNNPREFEKKWFSTNNRNKLDNF